MTDYPWWRPPNRPNCHKLSQIFRASYQTLRTVGTVGTVCALFSHRAYFYSLHENIEKLSQLSQTIIKTACSCGLHAVGQFILNRPNCHKLSHT